MVETIYSLVIAFATALLVWSLVEISSNSMVKYQDRFTKETKTNFHEMFISADPGKLFMANMGAMILACMLMWLAFGSLTMVIAVLLAFVFLPRFIFRWLRKRRIEQIENQLADTLLLVAGGARAGQSLILAVRQVSSEIDAPFSQELETMQREQRLGVAIDDSLENLARRVPCQAIALMVSAMRIANETGGGLAETLERTASTIRAQHAMELKIRALTAQGKMQAWVVGLMPLGLGWALYKLEPAAMSQLWSTEVGWGVMALIMIMEFFGVLLIRRIVAIDI